ncbi:MAG: translation initiation factor IF-2 [Spirochaetaceae bacterium]|nr:MAG: translation initiation factor IF-2 [Spirochaetaceae bacterium]
MSTEQDKEKKPKATLIKHKKESVASSSDSSESPQKKKRVVVIRKGSKPSSARGQEAPEAPRGDESNAGTPKKQQQETKPPAEKSSDSGSTSSKNQSTPSTENKGSKAESVWSAEGKPTVQKPREPQKRSGVEVYRPKRPTRDTAPPAARKPNTDSTRPGGSRPPRPGASGPRSAGGFSGPPRNRDSRPPRPAGGASPRGGGRPGMPPRPGMGGAPPRPEAENTGKTQQKRFFKSKKKDNFRRERHQEKAINYKKNKGPKVQTIPKEIDIMEVVTVSDLARKMNLKASDLIGKLMGMGMMVTINQQIDAETAEILAAEYDCKVNIVSLYDETIIETSDDEGAELRSRPPIITVMGHVDHGKTKLLDAIRRTNVISDEFGGITQHIGAYQVNSNHGAVTFLDTPGHEAFTLMRARGAQITDIVILVVAANDGVMPQTREAIDHAKAADVPIIVAINKVDLPDANPDRVRQQLSDLDLMPEEWGGSTLYVEISALKGQGIDQLLETIFLQAEVLELNSNYDANAEGHVIESKVDPGRGTVSTVLIERGTLRVGDSFVAGVFHGKVRAMFNDLGEKVEEATPSMPVEILGFTGIPSAGDPFQATDSEKFARQIGGKRQELRKVEEARNVKKVTLDNLYDSIQEGGVHELKVVIKGDVHGSVEALKASLEKLSTREIRLVAIHASAGAINEKDVMLASASNAIVIGFHVRPTPRASTIADQEKVEIRKYNIIYDAVEDIRSAMEGLLAPELHEETIGAVEVRDTFKVPKIGLIAGCYVTEGKIQRGANVRVFRDEIEIHTGKISSLKRFKDDAKTVETGFECGVGIENYNDLKVGDIIEAYIIKEVAKKLGSPEAK